MKREIMNDGKVNQAIRTLKAKGVTIKEIEQAYKYYDNLKRPKIVVKPYEIWD